MYKLLSTTKNWKEYFDDISDSPLAAYITNDFQPAFNDEYSLNKCRFVKVAVKSSTYMITILAGLEHEFPDLLSRKSLTVHIVGADEQKTFTAMTAEELLHLLPNLNSLTVGYIEPDATENPTTQTELLDVERCLACQRMGRPRRKLFVAGGRYHDFAQSELFRRHPPDLIVAFRSGHFKSETSTWRPALERILDLDIPALFTTYNKHEPIEKEKVFDEMGACFSKRIEKIAGVACFPISTALWGGMMCTISTSTVT